MLGISLLFMSVSLACMATITATMVFPYVRVLSARTRAAPVDWRIYIRRYRLRRHKEQVLSELGQAELFMTRMLESGVYTVHEIIGVAADMTYFLSPYFKQCYNRYFAVGTTAIEDMKLEIVDDSFGTLCDTLSVASTIGKQECASQLGAHLEHQQQMRSLRRQQQISSKEGKFLVPLILPIVAALLTLLYPYLIMAMEQMSIIW